MTELEANRKLVAERVLCWTASPDRWKDNWKPDEDRDQAFELVDGMDRQGLWLTLTSPWVRITPAGDLWWAGFTKHGTTGWNGRADYKACGTTMEKAIFNAVVLWAKHAPDLPPLEKESRQRWEAERP
jgi:hypothetical protein